MVKLISSYYNRLISLNLLLILIPILIISGYLYFDKINTETNNLQERLLSVSEIGADSVRKWIGERKADVLDMASNQLVVTETKKLLDSTLGRGELFTAEFNLAKQFHIALDAHDWLDDIVISDPQTGDVKFHTGISFPKTNLKGEKHFQDAVAKKIGLSEIHTSAGVMKNEYGKYEESVPTLLISAPIAGEVGIEGILTARINIFELDPQAEQYLTMFSSSDAYLVNSKGYFISKSAFTEEIQDMIKKRSELELRIVDPNSEEFTKIFQNANGYGTVWDLGGYNNYVGNLVVGAMTPVQGVNWYHVVEVDKDETLEGILKIDSYIRGNMLFTAEKKQITKKICSINKKKYAEVINKIIKLISK